MANFIDKVEVNGTEYEIVGPGAQFPLSNVANDSIYNGYNWDGFDGYSTTTPSYIFRWKRTGTEGNYEYELVLCLESDPADGYFSFQGANANGC